MFLRFSCDPGRNRFLKQRGYRRGIRYALLMIYPAHYLSRSLLLLGMSIESVGFQNHLHLLRFESQCALTLFNDELSTFRLELLILLVLLAWLFILSGLNLWRSIDTEELKHHVKEFFEWYFPVTIHIHFTKDHLPFCIVDSWWITFTFLVSSLGSNIVPICRVVWVSVAFFDTSSSKQSLDFIHRYCPGLVRIKKIEDLPETLFINDLLGIEMCN